MRAKKIRDFPIELTFKRKMLPKTIIKKGKGKGNEKFDVDIDQVIKGLAWNFKI